MSIDRRTAYKLECPLRWYVNDVVREKVRLPPGHGRTIPAARIDRAWIPGL